MRRTNQADHTANTSIRKGMEPGSVCQSLSSLARRISYCVHYCNCRDWRHEAIPNPKQLMAYLGLIPSEHSSGKIVRRGPITKTGNSHVRRVLIEAAWTYKMQARVSKILLNRQKGLPKSICEISWKAQTRLCARYRRLYARGKSRQTVVTAIARELSAFIWAIDKEIQLAVL